MGRSRSKTRGRPRANPRGVLSMTPSGYAFVQTPEGEFFIPASKTQGAFDGDLVEVAVQGHRDASQREAGHSAQRPSARVVRVLHRAHETVVGSTVSGPQQARHWLKLQGHGD